MKNLLPATALAAAALSLAVPAVAQDRAERDRQRSDIAFAELVEGRAAGEPVSCITAFDSNRVRVVEHVGITYERGDTIWVARARNPRNLDNWDVPVIERFGSQLCNTDVRRTIDRGSGMFSGVLFLDQFVPYREIDG